ncbi:MAG: DUF3179 domain-containing protein [Solirubrobacteraceae bacterium]
MTVQLPRWSLLALLVSLGGCGSATRPGDPGAPARSASPAGTAVSAQASAAQVQAWRAQGWSTDFGHHAVALSQFQDGGPPRDGIPPIDHPKPVSLAAGDGFLTAREPVIAVDVGGQARAYPEQILVWHEIVNDDLGGVPIAVSYCPLCNSALVFDRRVGDRALTFGTTGKLRDSDLVMWDRQTQSWWQQFTGTGLVGRYTATTLRPLDSQVLSWAQFKASYPHGTVLSRDTGFQRPYGSNPYPGYDTGPTSRPPFYSGRVDPRLPALERVVAMFAGSQTAVVSFSTLVRHPVIVGSLAGQPLVVLYAPGVVSALDAGTIAHSRDVGTAGAFHPVAGGRTLRFSPAGHGLFRDQTGSTWNITGRAVAGPSRGMQLRPLRHDEQFWFALAAFLPQARLLTAASGS